MNFSVASVLFLVACAAPVVPEVRERETEVQAAQINPEPEDEPADSGTTTPPPTACQTLTPGLMCRWMGVEALAFFAPDGREHRLEATLNLPVDVAFGPDGTPYVVDHNNHRIRVVDPDDSVRTIVGVGVIGDGIFDPSTGLWRDGPGVEYKINHPTGLAFDPRDPNGLYIAAWHNSRVLRYDLTSLEVAYVAGNGSRSFLGDGGPASEAAFDLPAGIAFDETGALYVGDQGNQVIRRIGTDGILTTVAGIAKVAGFNGDGPALEVTLGAENRRFSDPTLRGEVHDGALYFTESASQLVRRFDPATGQLTTVAGMYVPDPVLVDTNGDYVGDLSVGLGGFSGDGGPAVAAQLDTPLDLAFGLEGEFYIADSGNHCIRVVTPDGAIDTFAGVCGVEGLVLPSQPSQGDGLPARESLLSHPAGVAVDANGNVYIADMWNQVIRVVYAEATSE